MRGKMYNIQILKSENMSNFRILKSKNMCNFLSFFLLILYTSAEVSGRS